MTAPPPPTIMCPLYSPFFGHAGATMAMALCCIGAAYGTAKSGSSIAAIGVVSPSTVMPALIPVIMSGILSIFGLVIALFISGSMKASEPYSLLAGSMHLASGLVVGCSCIASGYAIGVLGDAGVRALVKQARAFVGLVLVLIFAEVLGMFGFLIAIIINNKAKDQGCF